VGNIKNTEGSAMSVGIIVVRLKYGLYVGQLSKWFVFVNSFMFLVVCLMLHCRLLGLLITQIYAKLSKNKNDCFLLKSEFCSYFYFRIYMCVNGYNRLNTLKVYFFAFASKSKFSNCFYELNPIAASTA
jgi:hypothetical protein